MAMTQPNTTDQPNQAQRFLLEWGEALDQGRGVGDLLGMTEHDYSAMEHQAYKFYSNQRYESARLLVDVLISFDPRRTYALTMRGDIAIKEREPLKAIRMLTRAMSTAPEDAVIQLKLAEAFIRAGNRSSAHDLLREIDPHALSSNLARRAEVLRGLCESDMA